MTDCIFCKIINGEIDCYKLYEDEFVLVFLDINPMSVGHALVIPKKHYKDITDIDLDILKQINKTTKKMYELINTKLKPDGIRIVQNNGICQEVKHYHTHIVPVYEEKFEEDLEVTYKKLMD